MTNISQLFEKKIKPLAALQGIDFRKCTEFHFQLKGVFLVNVYPTKASYYIQGANHKIRYHDLKTLIDVALGVKNVTTDKPLKKRKQKTHVVPILYAASKMCWYCGLAIENINDATIEHKIPLSRGGSNRRDNLTLSHGKCNWSRGSKMSVKRSYKNEN